MPPNKKQVLSTLEYKLIEMNGCVSCKGVSAQMHHLLSKQAIPLTKAIASVRDAVPDREQSSEDWYVTYLMLPNSLF